MNNEGQQIQNETTNRNTRKDSPKAKGPYRKEKNSQVLNVGESPEKVSITKTSGKRSKKVINAEDIIVETEKKTKITLFRCKYCPCVYPTHKDIFDHEMIEHKSRVEVNRYYGPENLILEEDLVNQVKKLSWPHRKKRYNIANRRKIIENNNISLPSRFNSEENVSSINNEDQQLVSPKDSKQNNKRKRSLENENIPSTQKDFTENVPKKKMKIGPRSKKLALEIAKVSESYMPLNPPLPKNKKVFVGPKSKNPKLKVQMFAKKYLDNQCKYCKCELDSQAPTAFLAHLKVKQCNRVQFLCSLCCEDFSDRKENFDEHKKNCNVTKFFTQESKCARCLGSVEKTLLQEHLLDQHQALFKCFICAAEFNQKDCLVDHFEKCSFRQSINTTFTCETCKHQFENLICLKKHYLNSHTNLYLNEGICLDYNKINQWVENKKSSNVLPYQRTNYKTCNSKGAFFCGIKSCKKVLDSIFELELHIQQHCRRVRKKNRVKNKGKRRKNKSEINTECYRISICDNYLLKNYPIKPAVASAFVEENLEIKPKDSFLYNFDLKRHSGDPELEIDDLLNDLTDDNSSQYPPGIFELSDNTKVSAHTSLQWFTDGKISASPLVLTIDSDDD